jgi:hypothetical protein
MKMPRMVTNRKGKQVQKQYYSAIGVVVAMRLKEDEELSKLNRKRRMRTNP